uniref:SMB domain-containing protein n=1 Tax=Globodera pallida TaxID=36090 RepID=A0A183C4T1_GLOPA
MLGWWRLLLLYGIAINLGIDKSTFTTVVVNGPNALGVNGSTASNVNGSTSSDVNGSTASNVNGSTASNVNGSTSSNVNGSTASNVNGSTSSNVNEAIVEKKNIVIRRRRQKRDLADPFGLSKGFTALFATALVKAVAMKSGKRVVNTEADYYLGVELSGYKFFAGDPPNNCTVKCPCGWFDCVPFNEGRGDACCATSYTMHCCPQPTYSRGNTTKLDSVGQKLCLKAPISCRIDSTEACDFEQQAFILVKQPTRVSLQRVLGLLDENCEASHFRMAFYGQMNYRGDVRLFFFLENREGCPMCGWELCTIMTKGLLSCSCCAYEFLAYCRWQMSRRCKYVPNGVLAEGSPDCPDCQWKMSFSDDDTVFKCCDQSTFHQCTKVDVLPDDPLSISTLVNVNAACKRLVHDQCHCGWGSCFPREGRAASECCNAHYALVCCEASRRLKKLPKLNGINTKAEIPKVFLMLLVMRLAVRCILAEMATN